MKYTSQPEDPYRSAVHTDEMQLAALKKKIDALQKVYLVLFLGSLALIAFNRTKLIWALLLGSAVCTRLYRQSQVTRYNAIIARGGPSPLV